MGLGNLLSAASDHYGREVAKHSVRDSHPSEDTPGVTKGDSVATASPYSSLAGNLVKGGITGGILGGAFAYSRLSASARTGVAKYIGKLWKAPELSKVIHGKGVNKGLPGAIPSLLDLAFNMGNYSSKAGRTVVEEIRGLTAKSNTKNLATIQDFLDSDDVAEKLRAHVDASMQLLAAKSKLPLSKLKSIPLAEGIVKEGDKLLDYRERSPGGILANLLELGHRKGKIPFTSFAPTDMFLHKAWANQHKMAILGKGARVDGVDLEEGAVAIGNKLIDPDGGVTELSKPLHIIQENTSLAFSSHIVSGTQKYKSDYKLLADGDFGAINKALLQKQIQARELLLDKDVLAEIHEKVADKKWNAVTKLLEDNPTPVDKLPIGVQYAREHSMGRNVRVNLQKLFNGKTKFKDKPSLGGASDVVEKYTEEDLNIFDKVGKFLRTDSDKYLWVDDAGKTIGEGAVGPIKTYGTKEFAPGAFADDIVHKYTKEGTTVATTHTAVTSKDLLTSVGHFLAERPIRLFEQMTGMGIKPSSSITKTLLAGTIGAGALLYGTVEAAQYTNFLAQGVPSKALAAGIGGAQVAASGAMDVTGVTTVADTAESILPGVVNSFAGQLARAIGLPILGAYLGEKYLQNVAIDASKHKTLNKMAEFTAVANASGRKLGGIIGVAAAFASTMLVDPTQYSGETYDEAIGDKRVAVRNARYWFLGRCLTSNTLVYSSSRNIYAPIYSFTKGELVVNREGNITKVVGVHSREVSSTDTVYNILTPRNRLHPLQTTHNHPLWTITPEVCKYVTAATCRPDKDKFYAKCKDKSCSPTMQPKWKNTEYLDKGDFIGTPVLSFGSVNTVGGRKLTPGLAWVLGHFIAEGSIHRVHPNGRVYSIQVTATMEEHSHIRDSYDSIKGITSITPRKAHKHALVISGVTFTDWLYKLLYQRKDGSFGDKEIPFSIIDLDKDLAIEFIRGYFYGDGSFEYDRKSNSKVTTANITCCMRRVDYLLNVQTAMEALGLLTYLNDHSGHVKFSGQEEKYYPGARLHMYSGTGKITDLLSKEYDKHPAENDRKSISKQGFFLDSWVFYKVIDVQSIVYEGLVYDLEVEEGSSFLTAQGIVHNSKYGGDKIKYHEESLSARLWDIGAADYTNYGSQTQRWMHSALPTPTNLFGLIPLLDPYYVENHNADLRPYPVVAAAGGNVPVLGPVVQATIGQIIKPSIHADIDGYDGGSYGPAGAAQQLGYQDMSGHVSADSSGKINQQIGNLQDYTGLFGFVSGFPLRALTGSDTGFGGGIQLESSDNITNIGRELEEMNLGGAMGQSELPRRLFPTRAKNTTYVNPLQNSASSWLPGTGSMFEGDHDFVRNFHGGDFYTTVEKGDIRLPGPGYEAKHGLHGGDDYSSTDIYNILSDVAPGSQAHAHYKRVVGSNIESGAADQRTIDTFNAREAENAESLKGKYEFVDYANKPRTSSETMGGQIKEYLGFVNTNTINQQGPSILAPVQSVWDTISHAQIPGVGQMPGTSWLQGKFLHNRTPHEEYVNTQVTGKEFADWTTPYDSFIEPLGFQAADLATSGQFIPQEVHKRREIEEYFDKLKYMKSRRLQGVATEVGNTSLSSEYSRKAEQTVVGMQHTPESINRNIFKAVPYAQKPFVSAIAQATPTEVDKWREVLPKHQMGMWEQIWKSNNSTTPIPSSEDNLRADQEVSQYFSTRELPEESSNVWNPDVSLEEYKLTTFEQEGLSYYDEGIPEAKAREYRALGRVDLVIDTSPFSHDVDRRNELMTELQGNHFVSDSKVTMSAIPRTSNVHHTNPERMNAYNSNTAGRF